MEATGAELVAGNIIHGAMAGRKKVGALSDDGVFNLNDDGKALAEAVEAEAVEAEPVKKTTRTKKAEAADAPAAE